MAGAYTDITSITAPGSAALGETVPVTVKVKNIDTYYSHLIRCSVPYDSTYFIDKSVIISPGDTYSFSGNFPMPNKDIIIYAYTYYPVGAEWIFDDQMSRSVDLEEAPAEWTIIGPDTTLRISVVEEVPPEWSIIGSDITLRIDVIPEVPPEWQIIGSDITLAVSLITVGWQVIGDDLTLAVALSEVAPPPCTPGETKCIGPDLYECSLDGEWVLVEENSPQCAVEEKEFPWLLVAGGLGVAAVAVAATTKKKKPIK